MKSKKKYTLVIVESPKKCLFIEKCLNTNDRDYSMICDTWSNKVLQAFNTFPKFDWEK